ncbi:MAG: DUF4954 family protein [Treponema sp.]|nr:DUF4954 family protein [Treponema sp.]
MTKVTYLDQSESPCEPASELTIGKRRLTADEINILKNNRNKNTDESWGNFFVDNEPGNFNPNLIHDSYFEGFIILGRLKKAKLQYHDLILETGIYNSSLRDVVTGNDVSIKNVAYLDNYRFGDRVILFNIQEICCTNHAKFGNGILKDGEPENHRVWIGVGNENEGRAVLAFENMIPADAYLWSHYREDPEILDAFKRMTEKYNDGKRNTFGYVGSDTVIKNSSIIKDVKIGENAYIKGALKLKNITILSSEDEPSQIGEGVEMVNGIMGYASHAFYQAVAVRFVIGRNCQLKYGVRILNSVLGDNSTVSCCEILNNLIFPFHEQHHNSSFLIATTCQGQSNIASGATVGSNHNSRSPDGEIFAKRGFWPGLCSDFKHNSKFASFVLASKGSYQHELDIPYPFALLAPGSDGDQSVHIIPAFWFMYDMFAIARNKTKFIKRDKRHIKIQHIETDPFAPDTMQEVLEAIKRLVSLTARILPELDSIRASKAKTQEEMYQAAKDYMHHNENATYTLRDNICQKKYGATIFKPVRAYKMYRKVLKYFATKTLLDYFKHEKISKLTKELWNKIRQIPLYTEWENAGGQIIPCEKRLELFSKIKNGEIDSWEKVHQFYDKCQESYELYKVRYSIYLLEQLYSRPAEEFSEDVYSNIIEDVTIISSEMYKSSYLSREKDYTDYYRQMVYNSVDEMNSILGTIDDNSFLKELKITTDTFNKELKDFFDALTIESK